MTESNEPLVKVRTVEVAAETPVFICDLSPLQAQLDLARLGIEELRISHPQSPESNVKATYMSPWHSHIINPKLKPLADSVRVISLQASKMLSANLEALNIDMVVTDCWGIIYDQSSYTQRHNHFPSDFSCSIYLEAHEDSAPIIFSGKLHIKPKANMLVMFPGSLIHEVPPTVGRRVVVAMNINKTAMFKQAPA